MEEEADVWLGTLDSSHVEPTIVKKAWGSTYPKHHLVEKVMNWRDVIISLYEMMLDHILMVITNSMNMSCHCFCGLQTGTLNFTEK